MISWLPAILPRFRLRAGPVKPPRAGGRFSMAGSGGLLLFLLCTAGWAGEPCRPDPSFSFLADTFAYENELRWEYHWDAAGHMTPQPRDPAPSYSHRCVSMARAARQFEYHARFEPGEPKATAASYGHWARLIMRRDSRWPSQDAAKLVIPGYANLREFSREHEALLKETSGGAWRSYLQRGNWRMVFPFSRVHQARVAAGLIDALEKGRLPLVHLVCFPTLALNHTVLLYGVRIREGQFEYVAYDPNDADQPVTLLYDCEAGQFRFSRTLYFAGGPVKVYEIYRNLCY